MRNVSDEYKQQIITLGRQQDVVIEYDDETLDSESIESVTLYYTGSLLKSIMRSLIIVSTEPIEVNTEISFKYGTKVDDEFEYIQFENFIVTAVEKQIDAGNYRITCYDKMVYSMKDYEEMDIVYPLTVKEYINAICTHLELEFANYEDTFANMDKVIASELYLGIGYTFRDVLDDLAEVVGGVICINSDNQLEIRYINNTNQTIDEESLKNVNVNFGEKYGPINSIVLSRAGGSDNVYLQDVESIEQNGLCEIKITDNQIMSLNNRSQFLPDLLRYLGGIEFYLNDYSSTGITFLDIMDSYNVSVFDNVYNCLMLNDEIDITQGLEENVFCDRPESSETDYKKADKVDQLINQTNLTVDKINQVVESTVSRVDGQNVVISNIQQQVGELNSKISEIADITTSAESIFARVDLDNVNESEPIAINVKPMGENISYLYPRSNLYPSSNLFSKTRILRFTNTETDEVIDYLLPTDLLYYNSTIYDEFILNYDTHICHVNKKCEYDANGNVVATGTMETLEFEYPSIQLSEGDYTIELLGYDSGYLSVRLMASNIYTAQFATKVEMESKITQTSQEITAGVSQTLQNYSTTTQMNSAISVKANEINSVVSTKVGKNEVVSSINQTSESVKISANKLNLSANDVFNIISNNALNLTSKNMTISSTNFNVDKNGNMTCNNSTCNSMKIRSGNIEMDSNDSSSTNHILLKAPAHSSYMYITGRNIEFYNNYNMHRQIDIGVLSNSASGYIDCNGDIYCVNIWADNLASDKKLKKNIKNSTESALERIKRIHHVSFDWKNKEGHQDIGYIAQEMELIDPNYIQKQMRNDTELYQMNLLPILATATKAIQELTEKIELLEKEISNLKGEKIK